MLSQGLQAAEPSRAYAPQPLASALEEFARITGFQLVYRAELTDGLISKGASAQLSAAETLKELLRDTGLGFAFINDQTVTIVRSRGVHDPAGQPDQARAPSSEIGRSVPGGSDNQNSTMGTSTMNRSFFARVASIFAASTMTWTAHAQEAAENAAAALEEVVVTGSRLQAAGFNAPTPVTVVGTETIQQRAPANIVDVLVEQPAFRIAVTDSTRNGSGGNGAGLPQTPQALLDLRALGALRTLTLINGKRSVGTNWDGTVDTNIVPVGLVERVDVVTGGASAAYGSDAVAGVVNIVLRNKMQGISATAQLGMTEYSSAPQYTFTLAGGTSLMNDRMHVIAGIDYNQTKAIDDVYGKKWAQDEIGNFAPTTAYRTANGAQQTVVATGVEPASTAPGGLFVSTATGPAYTFDANGNPVAFSRGTISSNGQLMIGSTANYGHNLNNINYLRLPQERIDTMGRVSYELTDNIEAYVEVSDARNSIDAYRAAELQQGTGFGVTNPAIVVSRTNPNVTPATLAAIAPLIGTATTFSIGRIHSEFGFDGLSGTITKQEYETLRIVAGLEGKLSDSWNWDAYYQSGQTRLELNRNDFSAFAIQKAVNGCVATLGSPGFTTAVNVNQAAKYDAVSGKTCVPFNPFGVGRNSQAALDYVQNATWQIQHMRMETVAASINGALFALPAGDVAVATGAEYRRQSLSADSDNVSAEGIAPEGGLLTNNLVESFGKSSVKEVFAEVGVPVMKDRPGVKSLDLNAAARVTDYELSGTVTTWKGGLTWDPIDVLRVRFTRSHDIRAPDLRSLFFKGGPNPQNVFNTIPAGTKGANGTVNPAGVNPATQISVLVPGGSGNPELGPETADTTTVGLVFKMGGFNASVDYYEIKMEDAIAGPGAQQTVDQCAAGDPTYCKFITFGTNAAAGGIDRLEPLLLNLNLAKVQGYDFEVGYQHLLGPGSFKVRALVNYQPHNYTINTYLHQKTENENTLASQPELAYNLNVGYDVGRWNMDVQIRGFAERRGNPVIYNADGSVNSATILGPEDAGYAARFNTSTNDNTISKNRYPGQYFVNPSVTYKVNDNISAYVNIDNLLNVEPPDLTVSSIYDLIGRRYRVGVRASF